MIPIKGCATFDPLKSCLIGRNFRHRYFWDPGVHCITQDLYRKGTIEEYFG